MHVLHWFIDFIGVNNGQNEFSTHMYNFWSGFGGNISLLALTGTVFGVYRHGLKRFEKLTHLDAINPLNLVRKKDKDN
jgi:hypothetical protein